MISRKIIADTFAMVVFTTIVGMIIELRIAGLTLPQSIQARILAMPINLLIGRPNGKFRDFLVQRFKANEGGPLRKALVDIASFVFFQVPLYPPVLVVSGATLSQIITASVTVALFSTVAGRPYGVFLDFSRRLFNVH